MTDKEFAEKNISLSFELSKYIIEHPEFEDKIPDGAEVVILLDDEPEFNSKALELAEKSKTDGMQVVFIRAKGIASTPLSRLINPELATV